MCIAQMILLKFTDDVPFCILSTVCIMLIRTIKRAFLGLFILILASGNYTSYLNLIYFNSAYLHFMVCYIFVLRHICPLV